MRYGSAITAYHDGFDTICTVRVCDFSESDFPLSISLVNSNFFVCGPRTGSGSDSVTSVRRESTGSSPSSPSESRPVEPTAL